MTKISLVLLAIVVFGYESANSQNPVVDKAADTVSRAAGFVELLRARDFLNAEKTFDDTMKSVIPAPKLEETWDGLLSQVGAYKRLVSTRTEVRGDYDVVIFTSEFENAEIDIQIVFDKAKKVAGLFFTPAKKPYEYTRPGYVDPKTFLERELTVGKGEWRLPGTLTVPVGKGPFPAVVLVHGSGPNDRDESIGPQKPFRDLAWGLATRGIAVLRYEKRTKQYSAKLSAQKSGLTVKEETVDDALAAVSLLRETVEIDQKRIFVLGHSLGGMLIPRIGKADPDIAGLIVLAGAAKPTEDAILEQTIYIFSIDGTLSEAEEDQIEKTKKEVAKVKAFEQSDAGSSAAAFGISVDYWLDLRGYDPPVAAKELKQPLLVLQGERDYQVTMEDFQRWKSELSSGKNVTFRTYPKLNHLFAAGEGMSVPAEYELPGHVDEAVVDDIATWINDGSVVKP